MNQITNEQTYTGRKVIKIIAALIAVFLPETLLGLSKILAPIETLVDYLMHSTSDEVLVIYELLLFGIPLIGFIILMYTWKLKELWLKIILLFILALYLSGRSLILLMAIQR